jgi:hypothetical protein
MAQVESGEKLSGVSCVPISDAIGNAFRIEARVTQLIADAAMECWLKIAATPHAPRTV